MFLYLSNFGSLPSIAGGLPMGVTGVWRKLDFSQVVGIFHKTPPPRNLLAKQIYTGN